MKVQVILNKLPVTAMMKEKGIFQAKSGPGQKRYGKWKGKYNRGILEMTRMRLPKALER